METIEVRQAKNRDEFEQACDLWADVFPEDRAFFRDRLVYDAAYSLDTTWLAWVDGTMAAAAQIFPFWMKWGTAELRVGGIGNVATRPEFRKRGLAQSILRLQSAYMKAQGYDLSLLMTGINPFYEKIGWHTLSHPTITAARTALKRTEIAGAYRIRAFEAGDLDQVMEIYEETNAGTIGPMVRTKAYWLGQTEWKAVRPDHFLVAENNGNIVAYLRYKTTKESVLHVADCGYRTGEEQAAEALLSDAAAKEQAAETVRAALPAGSALYDYLQRSGAGIGASTGHMWKSINFPGTLAKISSELALRIGQNGGKEGIQLPVSLLFTVGGEQALVRVGEGTVEALPVTDSVTYQTEFVFRDDEWLTLLLKGADAWENRKAQGGEYVRALFPERPFVFWSVDNF